VFFHGLCRLLIKGAFGSMANVFYAQAKYPEALKVHEDVLAIRVERLGPEHPLVADTYNK
jgi:hypothetical protein